MGDPQEAFDLEELIERSSEPFIVRDRLDFEELFRRYAPRIRAIALKRTPDRHLAEDIVQETLLKAYRYQNALDRNRPIWPWLSAIASNVCSDLVRRASRDTHLSLSELTEPESDLPAGDPDPADNYTQREVLTRALASLNPRHRRILLLRSEGWNYQDIADLEGISFLAMQSTLHRARERFRANYDELARESGLEVTAPRRLGGKQLPAILLFPSWVAETSKDLQSRVRSAITTARQAVGNAAHSVVSAGPSLVNGFEAALAIAMTTALLTGAPAVETARAPGLPANKVATLRVDHRQRATPAQPVSTSSEAPEAARLPAIFGFEKLHPNYEKTPEETRFYSITASPDYINDHTLFATGRCNGMSTCNAVFKSTDGGASWVSHPAFGFVGGDGQLLVSPDLADGRRLFTIGWQGLQQSDNEGRDWQAGFVLLWNVQRGAFSPNYIDDHRILLTTSAGPISYSAETGQFEPAKLDIPSPLWEIVGSSSSRERGPVLYVSAGALYECTRFSCSRLGEGKGGWKVFPSPGFEDDGVMWALNGTERALVSTDGGLNFRDLGTWAKTSDGYTRSVNDLALFKSGEGSITTYAASAGSLDYESSMRSTDGGSTWSVSRINLEGFRMGTYRVIVTPTGRLLTSGYIQGIACSEDGGVTWAPRCSPER